MRLNEALGCNTILRVNLRGALPADAKRIDFDTDSKYPTQLVKILPEKYIDLGIVTEQLLRFPIASKDNLARVVFRTTHVEVPQKVLDAESTRVYLSQVQKTRDTMVQVAAGENLDVDRELSAGRVTGHPDFCTPTQVFEVKTTGKVREEWGKYLLQAFAYAAMHTRAKYLHIVLPLQAFVYTYDLSKWAKRDFYRMILEDVKEPDYAGADDIYHNFLLGWEIEKKGSLFESLSKYVAIFSEKEHGPTLLAHVAVQIYLSGNATTKINIPDEDVAQTRDLVDRWHLQVYVHAPHAINLAMEPGTRDDYAVECVQRHLTVASSCGFKGVVVHVGKYLKMEQALALEYMKRNVVACLSHATPECPLLVETPAGQGTELLTGPAEELGEFCVEVNALALSLGLCTESACKICIDTCHVFACGHDTVKYLRDILDDERFEGILSLVHFNDSSCACGSKKDRHAAIGMGLIGTKVLRQAAEICQARGIPMVRE